MTDQELLRKIYADVAVVKNQNDTIITTQQNHTSAIEQIRANAMKADNRLSILESKEQSRAWWTKTAIASALGAAATAIAALIWGKP